MAEAGASEVRLATFNLLHGMRLPAGGGDLDDLGQVAAALDCDLLGLQEVDRQQDRSGGVDQAAVLAQAMGAVAWRFVPSVHGTPGEVWTAASALDGQLTDGPTYGIALLSRYPVTRWWVRRFAPAPVGLPLLVPAVPRPRLMRVADEPRVAIAAQVEGPRGPFTVVTCHLSFVPGWNVRQLRAIVRWAAGLAPPVLLLGDLNLPGRVPQAMTGRGGWVGLARAATYPSYGPRVQFDHVLARGLATDSVAEARRTARSVRLGVSDHCALTVTVRLT